MENNRRNMTMGLFAGFAGAGLLTKQAEAQTCTAPCYAQTAAETAAGVTPVNTTFPPGNILRYGTNATPGTTAMTTALQNAIKVAGIGGVVYIPAGTYAITGTVTLLAGIELYGDGWSAQSGTIPPTGGTILKYTGTANVPMLYLASTGANPTFEGTTIRNIAMYTATAGNTVGTAIEMAYCPFTSISNVYIASFNIGIQQGPQCYRWVVQGIRIFDSAKCMYLFDEGEDSVYLGCDFAPFRTTGIGVHLSDMSQTNTYIDCNFSECQFGLLMSQGDSAGDGTGTPYPMHATCLNCIFEDCLQAAIGIVTTNQTAPASQHPCLTAMGCRFHMSGTFGTANSGQAFIFATHFSQIKVSDITGSGFSYAAMIYANGFGYTASGTKPGPIVWELGQAAAWGGPTSFVGYQGSLSMLPGGICRLSSSSYSYTTGSGYQRVPFLTVVSDNFSWYNASNVAIQPSGGQTLRFKGQISIAAAPAGVYTVALYKNSVAILTLATITTATSGPVILSGEGLDVPQGAYYWICIISNQNFTLDTANSYFYAEAVGT